MDKNIEYWKKILQTPTPAYQEFFDAEHKYILEKIFPKAKVLDIGCGEGRNIRSILEKTKYVSGIDNDIIAVNDAINNFSDVPTVKILNADAVSLPFENKVFDAVTFFGNVLGNLDNKKEIALKEAGRVLKDDGVLILSIFSETAFEERIKVYKMINCPIIKIEGTKVIFDKSFGANVSEQFSMEELEALAKTVGMKITDRQKIGWLAYICSLKKVGI